MPKPTGPSDPNTVALIRELRKKGAKDKKRTLWTDLSVRLGKPRRQRPAVNLSKISRYAKSGDVVVIPGKVLASGEIKSGFTVAALNFSETAEWKIVNAGSKAISLRDLMKLPAAELKKVKILV